MRHALCWFALLLMVMPIACQSDQEEELMDETPVSPTGTPAGEGVFPRPTLTRADSLEAIQATETPEAYPQLLPPTDTASAYPGQPPPSPTVAPYPAGELAWILRPVGEQCADAEDADYADLQEAVTALAAAGVSVRASEVTELAVCAACGCPTSAHFRVQIAREELEAATGLGWVLEE